jgi:hypothetical protein
MEPVNKLFSAGPVTIAFDSHKHSRMTTVVAFVGALSLVWATSTVGGTYTVDTIADGLLASESRLSDLRLDYTFTHRAWNKPKGPMLVTQAIFAQKISKRSAERLRYLDSEVHVVDPNTKNRSLQDHTLASFNGEATVILRRKVNSGKPMKGYVLGGYKSDAFGGYAWDPHTKIWYYHPKMSLGAFLKKYASEFRVESQSEALDGIPATKLVGTWQDSHNGKTFSMKLWVSPERSFLPLKRQIIASDGTMLSETALYDLVQLPNGMWYPKTIRSPAEPPGIPQPSVAHIYEISRILIDPIPEGFFTPAFPPNTRVVDDILKVTYTTTK